MVPTEMMTVVIVLVLFGLISVVRTEYTSLDVTDCNNNVNSPAIISRMNVTPMPAVIPGNIYFSADMSLTRPVGASSLSVSIKRKGYWFDIPIPCLQRVGSCFYNNVCTMVDEMISENWAGMMGSVGIQIKNMMQSQGVAYNQCPQQPRTVSIRNHLLHLPDIPAILSWFAALKQKKHVLALVLIEDLGFLPLVREIQRLSTRSATLHSGKDGISPTRGRHPRSSIGTRGDYNAHIVMTETKTGNQLLCLDVNLTLKKACSGFRCLWGK